MDEAEDYTGAGREQLDENNWTLVPFHPNESMWDDGDRQTYCVVGRGEGEQHSTPADNLGEAFDSISDDDDDDDDGE